MKTVLISHSSGARAALSLALLLANCFRGLAAPAMSFSETATNYFRSETALLSGSGLRDVRSLADWESRRPELRREAAEMLGLDPMPEKSDLKPVITGKIEGPDFTIEKLHFQSRPHLYVTANLYLPKNVEKPAPAILYVCGHGAVITNGVSCGNKTTYQHHGIWFARHGYVCLILDTIQWGEILGHHHGTLHEGKWWWNSIGYTPGGAETWNAIRGLDYLVTRPEVDPERLGITGRSGGGIYSWFVAALDDRVKVIVPVAGMTDLENYVVDGAIDGHCDCMFFVNTHRWDYPTLAALCAPRPLMLGNSGSDTLFPLTGVMRLHDQVQKIYSFYNAKTNFALVITPGPHQDTPDLQVPAFRWFNARLKHDAPPEDLFAPKLFDPQQLRVFDQIPADAINTNVEEVIGLNQLDRLNKLNPPPKSAGEWRDQKAAWMTALGVKVFAGWPNVSLPIAAHRDLSTQGAACETYEFQSQENVPLRLYVMCAKKSAVPRRMVLHVLDSAQTANLPSERDGSEFLAALLKKVKSEDFDSGKVVEAFLIPRDVGPDSWGKNQTAVRRRFMLLGQTLAGMQVWDIRRAMQVLRQINEFGPVPDRMIEARGGMAVNALYASLFEDGITGLELSDVPPSHWDKDAPDYLNVLKVLDIPQAAAMAAEKCSVELRPAKAEGWSFLEAMSKSKVAKLKLRFLAAEAARAN